MKLKVYSALFTFIFCFSLIAEAKGEVYLSISKKYRDKIKVGISLSGTYKGKEAVNLIAQDLVFAGSFAVPQNFTLINDTLPLSTWLTMGAEVVVQGTIEQKSERLQISCTVSSIADNKTILSKQYQGNLNEFRSLIHTISDEIVYILTGEQGIAQTSIAYISDKEGNKNVYIMDCDSQNKKRLTLNKSTNLFPAYAPDKGVILFTSYLEGLPYVYSLSQNGTIKAVSRYPGLNSLARVNKQGQIVLVLSKDGNPELYALNPDGTGANRLTNHPGIDTSPSWSPDGKQVVFVSNRSGTPQLYILTLRNKKAERLTFEGNYNADPAWSPKGNLIAYSSLIDGSFQVCTIDRETNDVSQLTEDTSNNESPTWAPNGITLCYTSLNKGKSALNIIDIYGREPHPITNPDTDGNAMNPSWSS